MESLIYIKGLALPSPAVTDIDADGDLDVFFGTEQGTITYYRNDGTRTEPRLTLVTEAFEGIDTTAVVGATAGLYPTPAFGDLDGDGDQDLLVGYYQSDCNAMEFLNTGTPTSPEFAPTPSTTTYLSPGVGGSHFDHSRPFLCDFDGDGDLDIFMGYNGSTGVTDCLRYFENTGTPQSAVFGAGATVTSVTLTAVGFPPQASPSLADLDLDGDLDLIVGHAGNGLGAVDTYLNTSGDPLSGWALDPSLAFLNPIPELRRGLMTTELRDFDGDSDVDLIAARESGLIEYWANIGTPEQAAFEYRPGFVNALDLSATGWPALADIDDDGDLDLFRGVFSYLESPTDNRGDLAFTRNDGNTTSPFWVTADWTYLNVDPFGTNPSVGLYACPTFADIDDDGDLDLFIGNWRENSSAGTSVIEFRNDGTPQVASFEFVTANYVSPAPPSDACPEFADIDQDGALDLFVGIGDSETPGSGALWYYHNDGTASSPIWASPVPDFASISSLTTIGTGARPRFIDIDHDGDLDLFLGHNTNPGRGWPARIDFFENTGAGTTPLFVTPPVDVAAILNYTAVGPVGLSFGDLDGDGDPEMLITDNDGGVALFREQAPHLAMGISTQAPVSGILTRTLVSGSTLDFEVSGETGTVSWSLVRDASGASLNSSTGMYTAGPVTGEADVIRARDDRGTPGDPSDDLIAQAHIHVISAASIAQAGQAIIVAGTRSGDTLWPSTDFLAQTAYQALLARGFTRDTVTLLTQTTNQDIDNDGLNDSDGLATLANLQAAFNALPPGTNRLFVYAVDHGGDTSGSGYVRLNPSETLTGAQLDAWLDALQTAQGTDVGAVIDCCRSGSFLDEMVAPAGQQRVVIASTLVDQDAYFTAGGHVSFSDALLGALEGGLTLGEAFDLAQGAMDRYQRAQMDDNRDGVYDRDVDGALARTWEVGAPFTAGADRPQIGTISANQTLTGGGTDALIWADDVTGASAVERVWAVVVSPEFQPNPDDLAEFPIEEQLTQRELTYDPVDERYEATLTGLSSLGAYKVILYARDVWGGVSFPKQTYINQGETTERLILCASDQAYDANSPADWSSAVINYAHQVALGRLIPETNITVLDASGNGVLESVDDPPTEAALLAAISGANGASQLTIQLVGPGSVDAFQINASDTLTASEL
ncbi:MAG: VCBS repeat-containing protein, partial [Candidatus Sumerlaeia bacterium]|nr:VCBS repeat-containing protein [Candidatus Sumerlaeia bacterium]